VRRSTDLYRALLDDLAFEVADQIADGDRVTSRWVMSGSNCGCRVRVGGITISRLRDGLIVEDWSSFDPFELLRGFGIVRVLRMTLRMLRAMRGAPVSDAWSR
jgi:predicted ester cyclase